MCKVNNNDITKVLFIFLLNILHYFSFEFIVIFVSSLTISEHKRCISVYSVVSKHISCLETSMVCVQKLIKHQTMIHGIFILRYTPYNWTNVKW